MSLEKVLSGIQILFSVRMRCENTQPFPLSDLQSQKFTKLEIIKISKPIGITVQGNGASN